MGGRKSGALAGRKSSVLRMSSALLTLDTSVDDFSTFLLDNFGAENTAGRHANESCRVLASARRTLQTTYVPQIFLRANYLPTRAHNAACGRVDYLPTLRALPTVSTAM